jgi:hypothetical protein
MCPDPASTHVPSLRFGKPHAGRGRQIRGVDTSLNALGSEWIDNKVH